jgi:predicted ATPase with chaperone activity
MLAARLPSILPLLSATELLEVSMIASVAGELPEGALSSRRPFRSPEHSAKHGGTGWRRAQVAVRPVSLAHHGVLFLDELPEFGGIMQPSHLATFPRNTKANALQYTTSSTEPFKNCTRT